MFIYSWNILQLCKLSAHAELFCEPILFIDSRSLTRITLSQKFEIRFLFSFLSFEKYVLRKL